MPNFRRHFTTPGKEIYENKTALKTQHMVKLRWHSRSSQMALVFYSSMTRSQNRFYPQHNNKKNRKKLQKANQQVFQLNSDLNFNESMSKRTSYSEYQLLLLFHKNSILPKPTH